MDRLLTAGLCGNTIGQDIQTLTFIHQPQIWLFIWKMYVVATLHGRSIHGRNHHILWGYTNILMYTIYLSPPIIGLLYCNMWHMICPPFMNPGYSQVDLLLFPIYFQFRKNKGNKTVWPPPPSIVHLVEPVNAGLWHRLKKTFSPTVTGA